MDLESPRFVLKILKPEMVSESYLAWFSDPSTKNYISYAKGHLALDNLKKYVEEKYASTNVLFFGIFSKINHQHIGNIKFDPVDFERGIAVLGILIGESEWRGKKVFSEISTVLEPALLKLKLRIIYLGVDKDNLAALEAYKKSGYVIDSQNFLKADLEKAYCLMKELN